MSRVSASTAGVFAGIMPVSAVVLSYMFLREPFRWFHLLGMFCVLTGYCVSLWVRPGMILAAKGLRGRRVSTTL